MYEDAIRHFWWNIYKDTKDYFKPIRNTQCTFSNYSCGFIKVPYTVKRKQFHFSHYRRVKKIVITKAIKNKTACTVIKAIYEEFILKFGMCKHLSIISDNGLEFINRWSKTLYKLLGAKSITTSVYKLTTNSQCERTHRSIISILRKCVCVIIRKIGQRM